MRYLLAEEMQEDEFEVVVIKDHCVTAEQWSCAYNLPAAMLVIM